MEPWGQAFPRLWPLQGEEREDRDDLLFPEYSSCLGFLLKEMPSKGPGVEGVSSMTEHRILTFVPKPPGGNLEIPTNAPKKALMGFWGAVPAGVSRELRGFLLEPEATGPSHPLFRHVLESIPLGNPTAMVLNWGILHPREQQCPEMYLIATTEGELQERHGVLISILTRTRQPPAAKKCLSNISSARTGNCPTRRGFGKPGPELESGGRPSPSVACAEEHTAPHPSCPLLREPHLLSYLLFATCSPPDVPRTAAPSVFAPGHVQSVT